MFFAGASFVGLGLEDVKQGDVVALSEAKLVLVMMGPGRCGFECRFFKITSVPEYLANEEFEVRDFGLC